MASRLAEQHEVLLLEAGPKHHAWDFRVHMPAALSEVLTSTAYNYGFHTESEAELDSRRLYCPRGEGAWRLLVNQRDDFRSGEPQRL